MLARTLMIAAMAALAYYLYRRWMEAQNTKPQPPPKPAAMKQCAHCGLHLPEKEAISVNQLYFCSDGHKNRYLQEHP